MSYDVIGAMARSYLEFPVQPVLADRVVCTWIDRRNGLHPVLPDACIDLVWDGEQLGVAGPDTRAWDVDATKTYVCIRFRPGAAPGVFGVPASELVDQDIALADIWGAARARALEDQLAAAALEAAPRIMEAALVPTWRMPRLLMRWSARCYARCTPRIFQTRRSCNASPPERD